MQDLMAKGAAWFDQQRRQHLSVEVEYHRVGSLLPLTCLATVVDGRWESIDASGQIVRMETRDFFINRTELADNPQRGDEIVMLEDGIETTYLVTIPGGNSSPWRWADRAHLVRRIHSTEMAVSTGTSLTTEANEILLTEASETLVI
jgi:hypothetical protein